MLVLWAHYQLNLTVTLKTNLVLLNSLYIQGMWFKWKYVDGWCMGARRNYWKGVKSIPYLSSPPLPYDGWCTYSDIPKFAGLKLPDVWRNIFFPSHIFPSTFSTLPSLSTANRPPPQIQLGSLGERCKLRSGVRVEPRSQSQLGIFWAGEACLVATILVLFVGSKMF